MKKILAFILAALMIAPICAYSVGAASEDTELYASVVSFDNKDLSKVSSDEAVIKSVTETFPSQVSENDYKINHAEITGEGNYSVTVDASGIDFTGHPVSSVVFDSTSDVSKLAVYPLLAGGEKGSAAVFTEYNGTGYFRFEVSYESLAGIEITVKEAGFGYDMTETFFCQNDYSAKFVIDNNVLPPTAPDIQLILNESGGTTAMELSAVPNSVYYHDFNSTKWPTVTVDENDRIYIVADAGRRAPHTDCFSSIAMVTSDDGGKTYSAPRRVFDSLLSDSDTGITYVGNGKLIIENNTFEGTQYLPGGACSSLLRSKSFGGDCDSSLADRWDENGYPIGGVAGTYMSLLKYVQKTDPDYDYANRAYIITSEDYGETWKKEPLVLKGTEGVDYTTEMREFVENYELSRLEGYPTIPAFTPHGPVLMSDGSLTIVGKVIDPVDLKWGELGVYKSFDEGETWQYAGHVSTPCNYHDGDFHEPDVCETADGVYICGLRSFVIYDAFSYDRGRTWTTPKQTELEGYPPSYLRMPNGDIVLATNYRGEHSKIFIYVSKDGGRTWSNRCEFKKGFSTYDMGYPDSVLLSDGTIVTAYYGNGDIIETTNWRYDTAVIKKNGWAQTDRGWIYFDGDGKMVKKQWQKDSKGWCYLDNNGFMVTAQSVKDTKGWCLVDESGYWVTKAGWNKVSGNWYYVGKDGYLVTNCWMKDSKGWCFLATNGLMRTNCSIQDTKGFCLVDKSGYWVTSTGWHKAGDNWYYVEKGGYLKTNGWMKDSKGWCFLDYEGIMKTNQPVKDSKGWCLVDASGYWVTNVGWHAADGDWYYVQKGGYLLTENWMNDSKGWCYLDKTGVMLKNVAVKDSKGWAVLDEDGYWDTVSRELYVNSFYGGAYGRGFYTIGSNGYLVNIK